MEEQKELTQEQSQETKPQEPQKQDVDVSMDLIHAANAAAARIEEANKRTALLLSKAERLKIQNTLSGQSNAGSQEVSKEQSEIKEARRWLKGTGFEDVVNYTE